MKYEILKKEIKNSVPNGEDEFVKYSIAYPEINGKDGFSKVFCGFYSLLAKRFEEFAKTKLYKEAMRYKTLSDMEFKPFGAVLKFVCSYNKGNVISIVMDAFVSMGGEKKESKRLSQNWDCQTGRMLLYEDFFDSTDKADILRGIKNEANLRFDTRLSDFYPDYEKRLKKGFSKNDFYLTPKGYGFFYPSGYLSRSNTPEVFFLLGYSGNGLFDPYGEN